MLRFSCEKALLQSAVNTTSRAVAAKSSIPALEGILLEGGDTLTLSGYNMQTGIRTIVDAQVQSPGRIVLSARLFGEMIRKMPDDVIVFAADENLSVHLTCGDASFEILGLSADDYPELPEVDDQFSVDIRQGTLKAMINQTSFAVSTNESRPVHTGSLFEVGDQDLTVDRGRLPSGPAPGASGPGRGRRLQICGPRLCSERGGENLRGFRRKSHHYPGQAPPAV